MILELTTKEVEKKLEKKKLRLDTVADLREGPRGGGVILRKEFFGGPPSPLISESGSATVTGNRTLIIAMTGRNALSIELIKPPGEQVKLSEIKEKNILRC